MTESPHEKAPLSELMVEKRSGNSKNFDSSVGFAVPFSQYI